MAVTIEEIIETIDSMTLMQVNELVKAVEEKFGVSATPVAVAVAAEPTAAAEEKTEFTVVLKEVPAAAKLACIKAVRAITGLGLKEAKDAVEAAPKEIVKDVAKDESEKVKKQLEEAGAIVEVK